MHHVMLVLCLLQPIAAVQDKSEIRFPVVSQPAPAPLPTAVPTLTNEMFYVVDSDVPLIVIASPAGLVKVTQEAGPMVVKAKFIDGGDKIVTRVFKGKSLWFVEAVGVGDVELIVIPLGLTKEGDVIRKTINVNGGQAPQPPPGPTPPGPVPTASKLQIVTFDDYKSRAADQPTAALLGDVGYWNTVRTAGHKFRSYDLANPGASAWQKWWKDSGGAGIPPPLVVFTGAAAPYQFLGAERMPASKDAMDALIKKYSGVK